MGTTTVAQPRAGAIGEPQRKWIIIPAVVPVPPPVREDPPARTPELPVEDPDRELVPA
jgi:hypothetical protein